jgi:hypothetical protein
MLERDESERESQIDLGTNCDLCVENGNVWVQLKRRKKTFQLWNCFGPIIGPKQKVLPSRGYILHLWQELIRARSRVICRVTR